MNNYVINKKIVTVKYFARNLLINKETLIC